ncbi:hypothetical protein AAFF_G00285920 [Aldrovandia affinis]|uniref:Uncharacterized protein n=1 Tax=Aldrovandia affinis TaxID=143900 RepID=A0AAD7TAI7_9TELE|nr:hypothetical protein AAFF_G00285920 [Aldrovandia affinis]
MPHHRPSNNTLSRGSIEGHLSCDRTLTWGRAWCLPTTQRWSIGGKKDDSSPSLLEPVEGHLVMTGLITRDLLGDSPPPLRPSQAR